MTEADMKPAQEKTIGALLQAFSQFPLSDENVQNATAAYVEKLHNGMEIKATLIKDDPGQPIVEISVEPLDAAGAAYIEDPRCVRGLDYYTGTVFEFALPARSPW